MCRTFTLKVRLPKNKTDGLTLPGFRSYLNVNTTQDTGVWTWE